MRYSNIISLLGCCALTVLGGLGTASADDSEVFFNDANASNGSKANILLILDTSGSMNRSVEETVVGGEAPYDPDDDYPDGGANCDSDYIYYWPIANGTEPTSCNAPGLQRFDGDVLRCNAAWSGLNGAAGYYGGTDRFVRLRRNSGSNYTWNSDLAVSNGYDIECFADNGTHGRYSSSSGRYPKLTAGSSINDSWTTNALNQWWGGSNNGTQYYLFSPNYIRYKHDPPPNINRVSRLDAVKTAVTQLMSAISNVNLGIMRYDRDADGGMVMLPISDLTDSQKSNVISTVNAFQPSGSTPLSETLYEAYRYLSGGPVEYGNGSSVCTAITNADEDENGSCASGANIAYPSVATSRVGDDPSNDVYQSPLDEASCKANNHIIYLTDGLPTSDTGRNIAIRALTGATSCPDADGDGYSNSDGDCLALLSEYMFENNLNGENTTVRSHFIGFGADVVSEAAVNYLSTAATAGGGQFHTADNITSLSNAFNAIVNLAAAETSATFTSPAVAVNSFNKTQVLEDLYVAMFKPTVTTRWPGNVKKFKLRTLTETDNSTTPPTTTKTVAIVGKTLSGAVASESAVDNSSGFFKDSARDFWQESTDTNPDITTKGGAANQLPSPATNERKLYTYIGANRPSAPVTLSTHEVTVDNNDITDAKLGTLSTTGGCGTATEPCRETLINWARGDLDGDLTDSSDNRYEMGAPVHSQPAVVIYANSSTATATNATIQDKVNDAYVFVATNDGYLHAIDVVSGEEKWAFIPQELLGDLKASFLNEEVTSKHYSLDGDIKVLRFDRNNDGKVDVGTDRVILYVGQGRGGPNYYAIDITDKDDPKFLWSLGSSDLGNKVAQSWSAPTLGRVKVGNGTTQNSQQLVLIFGGGYDTEEDSLNFISGDGDDGNYHGNAMFMIDAVSGDILWMQSKEDSGAFANMTHAIPSNVTVLDMDGDGYSDRMYVGDLAGQIWRFDISNCFATACASDTQARVTGGVIATLGAKASGADPLADNRTFYNAPDIARMVVSGDSNYVNIAIGSGDRSFPKSNNGVNDYFYSIRDYQWSARTQTEYNTLTPIGHADLTTVTGSTPEAVSDNGWKLALQNKEKALAQSLTVDGNILFTTFIPGTSSNSCLPTTGSGRVYAVSAADGYRRFDTLYRDFATTGLPTSVNIFNRDQLVKTTSEDDEDEDEDESEEAPNDEGTCMSGVIIQDRCVQYGARIKTFWSESGAN